MNNAEAIKLMDVERQELESKSPQNIYKKSIINVDEAILKPPVAFSLLNVVFGTLGNISMIIGKAKSRKSMFLAWITAGILGGITKYIQSHITQRKVIYFDTEQSNYHAQLQVKRIFSLLGFRSKNLIYVALREYNPKQRLEIIETALSSEDNIGYVIIDGIADLMSRGINDEEEATKMSSKLMKWSTVYNIHITCVLHQNKGDTNAKGHLGAYLVQKSETVLAVKKMDNSKEISIVSPHYSRGIEIEDIHFSIDEYGIPFIVEDAVVNSYKNDKPKKDPFDYEIETHKKLLVQIFNGSEELKRRDLMDNIMHYSQKHLGVKIADNKSRQWVKYYSEEGFIVQNGKLKPFKLNSEMG